MIFKYNRSWFLDDLALLFEHLFLEFLRGFVVFIFYLYSAKAFLKRKEF